MESLMQWLLGVIVYINDILVAGGTKNELLKRLDDVLADWRGLGFVPRGANVSSRIHQRHSSDKVSMLMDFTTSR